MQLILSFLIFMNPCNFTSVSLFAISINRLYKTIFKAVDLIRLWNVIFKEFQVVFTISSFEGNPVAVPNMSQRNITNPKVLLQGKLFQRFTHFLYCSVLSLSGNVNAIRMSQPDMESIFIKIIFEIFGSKETIM